MTMNAWMLSICHIFLISLNFSNGERLPIVMWHGLGDVCCDPLSLGGLQKFIEQQLPEVYIKSLKIGSSIREDFENAYLLNVNKQISLVCETIKNDTRLSQGYHALGISQGGQFLRAVAQRCPDPPMVNLVTLGSQHQGVYGLPRCLGDDVRICDYVRRLLNHGAYKSWIQRFLVPAQYWHDPFNEALYKVKSAFLADINNEIIRNETYKENMLRLKNFVMVKFARDSIVQPRETEWFGFYKENSITNTYTLNESLLYQEDWLGLQRMDKEGRLHFLEVDGDHIQFSKDWFASTIIQNFFA